MDSDRETRWAMALIAARRGDPAAWEASLREIACVLRGQARTRMARMGFGSAEAEDAVQETLIALHLKQATWDEARPIGPWIAAIARHKTLDLARREGRRRSRAHAVPVEEMAETLAAPAPDPAPDAARLVACLPARERGVVTALGLEGETVAAAARRLAITETAVRVAFHRGLSRLRSLARGGTA